MVLADKDILKLIQCNSALIIPFEEKNLGPSSIDLRLSKTVAFYDCDIIDLKKTPPTKKFDISSSGYKLKPGEFLLASTYERVTIPENYQGWIETKGNIARAGIQVHNCDGHIDPGFSGHIALELTNNNSIPIIIYPELLICQIFFFKLSQRVNSPYKGKYQFQGGPTSYDL